MDGYTPAQASAITGLPLAAVHKAIDSRVIRPRSARSGKTGRRLLKKEQLIYLQLEAEGLRLLPVGTRREIADSIQRSPTTDVLAVGDGTALFVEFKAARRKVESQLKQLHISKKWWSAIPRLCGERQYSRARGFLWTWSPTCLPRARQRRRFSKA